MAPPLRVDQDRGVDQDGHAPLGLPTLSRAASTSRAKSLSGAGAEAISSCQRVAETRRGALAGRISTTGTPFRTTSISSPAPIRLTTAENSRATSVALSRAMRSRYQIYLIARSTGGAPAWVEREKGSRVSRCLRGQSGRDRGRHLRLLEHDRHGGAGGDGRGAAAGDPGGVRGGGGGGRGAGGRGVPRRRPAGGPG